MANVVVSKPSSSKGLSRKRSFKLGLPLLCGPSPASSPAPSPRRSPAPDRLDDLRRVFRHFDRDMDGKISSAELRSFFSSVSDDAADDLPSAAGDLDFAGFVALMETRGGRGEEEEDEEVEDLRRAFEMFEAVKGSGRITPRGVQRVLSRLGDDRSFADCEAMIRAYDIDGDALKPSPYTGESSFSIWYLNSPPSLFSNSVDFTPFFDDDDDDDDDDDEDEDVDAMLLPDPAVISDSSHI